MRIWIDKASGTWGGLDSTVIVDLGDDADEHLLLTFLNNASDDEIIRFAEANGTAIS